MNIPESMIIAKTESWIINHRINSALPGYIIMSSRHHTQGLHELPDDALLEMSRLIATIDNALKDILDPKHIYIGRYGHTPNLPIHFHFIPLSQWVIDLFWQDERYRVLSDFGDKSLANTTDGAELTFFIWREFCERKDPPTYQGLSQTEIITLLRQWF